jgi:hypothetical protein
MSITILQQPTNPNYYSVNNPVELLISSNQTAQPNFKFQVSVYYDPAGANTLLAVQRYDIIPSTTTALIDVSKIIQSRISEVITNLRNPKIGIINETTKSYTANVIFQEYYGTIPAATGSTVTSSTIYYYNGSLKMSEFLANSDFKYNVNSSAGANDLTKRLLTGFENKTNTLITDVAASGQTYFGGNVLKYNADSLKQLQWLWKGSGGTNSIIQFYAFKSDWSSINGSLSLSSVQSYQTKHIGTDELILSGLPSLTSQYIYLAVCLKNATYQVSSTYLFEIDWSPCSRFDSYEIHWINRFGGWDSWVFDKRSEHRTPIQRDSYSPTFTPVSGGSIVRHTYDITNKNYFVSTQEEYTLRSRYLQEWELEGLEHLITSPIVYWNSPSGFINIAINNPEVFEHKKNNVDKLFLLQFGFTIDNQDFRQRN